MKICYIYDAIYPWIKGGIEKRLYEISRRLAERGYEVHLYGLKWWSGPDVLLKDGVYIHGTGKALNLYSNKRRSISEAVYFSMKVLSSCIKDKVDIIDCQQFPYLSCFSSKFISLARNTKFIITWYEIWRDYWLKYLGITGVIGMLIERACAKMPHYAIAINNIIKRELIMLGVPKEVIVTIPNGVDFYRIQNVKKQSDSFDIVYAGRLVAHKRVDILLRAVYEVKKEMPDIKCIIIGDGPEKNKLIGLASELNLLRKNVYFLGFLEKDEDVYSYIKSSKVFVLPSIREGFPNTILEANACGVPVIIINSPKNASIEAVKDHYNGFKVGLSPQELAHKILWLIQNEEARKKMCINAINFAQKHDWGFIVEKLEKVYEKLFFET